MDQKKRWSNKGACQYMSHDIPLARDFQDSIRISLTHRRQSCARLGDILDTKRSSTRSRVTCPVSESTMPSTQSSFLQLHRASMCFQVQQYGRTSPDLPKRTKPRSRLDRARHCFEKSSSFGLFGWLCSVFF